MSAHKPATPLPYRVAFFKKSDWHIVGGTEKESDYPRAAICKLEDDARYLAHAANAYQRLVACLRACVAAASADVVEDMSAVSNASDEASALLRSLGEDV